MWNKIRQLLNREARIQSLKNEVQDLQFHNESLLNHIDHLLTHLDLITADPLDDMFTEPKGIDLGITDEQVAARFSDAHPVMCTCCKVLD